MKLLITIIIIVLVSKPYESCGQTITILNNISMNESFETTYEKLIEISKDVRIITSSDPMFPLAEKEEAHIVCKRLSTKKGLIEKAVFSFGDGSLKYVEIYHQDINTLLTGIEEEPESFLGYDFYKNEKLFVKKVENVAWILDEEAFHPHLFIWRNPYLNEKALVKKDKRVVPEFLRKGMGGDYNRLKAIIEDNSSFTDLKELDNKDPHAQLQLNAFGILYMGIPRKIEARFGDNKLNVVWILTAKQEEERIKSALVEEFGVPIFSNKDWEVFDEWSVALRKDKPEVLLLSKKMGNLYKESFLNNKN